MSTRGSPEWRAKLSAAHSGLRTPHTAAWNANIAAALRGRKMPRDERVCVNCGVTYMGTGRQQFCTRPCRLGYRGRNRLHSPAFAHFAKMCYICGRFDQLAGDHDHDTGNPRGILCISHNVGLGYFQHDPALLRAAADYLETRWM